MIALTLDIIALLVLFSIAILRLNERKHSFSRTVFWSCVAAGTFGVACEQIIRAKVFGPDLWMIMMHVGLAGIAVHQNCYWTERRKRDYGHLPDRRAT